VRETHEETGIDLAPAERLGVLDDLHPRTPVLPPIVVRPFVFALTDRPGVTPNPEVRAAFWVPVSDLLASGVHREVTVTPRGLELIVPAYVLGGRVIWGMTERIITPFLEMLGGH
jgi:8-oxo-dGTP pyrophosphatase MutT (NUDIX family)